MATEPDEPNGEGVLIGRLGRVAVLTSTFRRARTPMDITELGSVSTDTTWIGTDVSGFRVHPTSTGGVVLIRHTRK